MCTSLICTVPRLPYCAMSHLSHSFLNCVLYSAYFRYMYIHTTMYYVVVLYSAYHASLYAVPSKQTRPMISCALVQCSFANPCSLFHLLTRSFSFLSLILIVYEKLYVRSIDAPLRCTSRLQVCFPLIYSCVHRIYALFLAYRTEPCTVCRIPS